MSTAMNFGGKSFTPRPPERGSFPLDHLGECKEFKETFMNCLKKTKFDSSVCREQSMDYLRCRMDRKWHLFFSSADS
ncbi:cytochrome c oxidase assembly protein COX19 isoform X2 [Narcine bancroftii]|uniref:cytochrome c oxidase assembly protein COX19 isoform X2 n=1 Tax=Narcine bancroftii TaxID=1343680 RepID=UPI003831FD61